MKEITKCFFKPLAAPLAALLAAGFLCVLPLVGCDLNGGEGDTDNTADVDWTNYTSGYALRVRNNTSQRLVAFKTSLSTANLLGGIPAGPSTVQGLKDNPEIFTSSADFPLILITEAQYIANKSNLATLEQTPFTRIWACYNASGDNENIYEISGRLGGEGSLTIQNNTSMNLELRLNSPTGETIGYAPAQSYNIVLRVALPQEYMLFPVFKRYDSQNNNILSIFPKYTTGDFNGQPKFDQFSLTQAQPNHTIQASTFSDSGQAFSTGRAYLIIENSYGFGIQLSDGFDTLATELGVKTINSGSSFTFTIQMPMTGQKYDSSKSIASYKLGTNMLMKALTGNFVDSSNQAANDPSFDLSIDTIYKIVTKNVNDELKFEWKGSQGTVTLDDFD
ncbi:MAG: hypothetical protein LBR16_00400 [Treponema sp.]|nr:hypothetical protein [Treponema sp.]